MNLRNKILGLRSDNDDLSLMHSAEDLQGEQLMEYVDLQIEGLKAQHISVSQTLQRSILSQLAFASYCLLALGTTDKSLLAANDSITLPIIGAQVTYAGFLFFAPLVLVAVNAYIHIFLRLKSRIEVLAETLAENYRSDADNVLNDFNKLPTINNLSSFGSKLISRFLCYWLTPLILWVFFLKSLPRPEPEPTMLLLLAGSATVWMLLRALRDQPESKFELKGWLIQISLVLTAVFVIIDISARHLPLDYRLSRPITRELALFNADLSGLDLRSYRFTQADLRGANLSSADLRGVNLESASLEEADLTGTLLIGANLDGTKYDKTILTGANLTNASIKGARLNGVSLRDAIVQDTDFSGSDLRRTRDLLGIQIRLACGDDQTKLPLDLDTIVNLANCQNTPSRDTILNHFINFDDAEFAIHGKYWSSPEQIVDIEDAFTVGTPIQHLVLYFPNAMGSQSQIARQIDLMNDIYVSNAVYPVFLITDSGLFEDIKNLIIGKTNEQRDREDEAEPAPDEETVKFTQARFDGPNPQVIRTGFSDWSDRLIEKATEIPGRALWREAKISAVTLFQPGALGFKMLQSFDNNLLSGRQDLKLHAVGEGAGALYLVQMLLAAESLRLQFESVTLLAPAITHDSYRQNMVPLMELGDEGAVVEQLSIYMLDDRTEVDDTVSAAYRKSFLYLISNAWEEKPKTPLLGMQKYSRDLKNDRHVDFVISSQASIRSNSASHGEFSNDTTTINDVLSRIIGQPASPEFN